MKLNNKFLSVLMIGSSLALVGCGNDDDNPIQELRNEVRETGALVQMQETWKGPCGRSALLNAAQQETYKFDGENAENTKLFFADDACTGAPMAEARLNGKFKIKHIEGNEMTDLDITYDVVSIKLNTQAAVAVFSAVNFCGVDQWVVGQDTVIAQTNGATCFVASVPSTHYGRILVDDSADTMYLTDEFTTDADQRQQDVNRAEPYTEVK